jgi:drug/metabolite transporter (DMT)-like permease
VNTFVLTLLALLAFAANSLLARAALRPRLVDAATFTAVRLVAGAAVLAVLVRTPRIDAMSTAGTWRSAAALFVYALAFSLAYLRLDAGAGALILFACVQATMIGFGIAFGSRPRRAEWVGLLVSLAGLVVLTSPGLAAPDRWGTTAMALAGVAWGVYSLRGRQAGDPVAANAANFARTVPMALLATLALRGGWHSSWAGLGLALASGALASGVGYALWYAALKGHTPTSAAIVQLAAPVFTAFGGVALFDEPLTLRLGASGVLVLGGIAVAVLGGRR